MLNHSVILFPVSSPPVSRLPNKDPPCNVKWLKIAGAVCFICRGYDSSILVNWETWNLQGKAEFGCPVETTICFFNPVARHQGFVGGAGGTDRRELMGGSEESQDYHEAAEWVDAQGLPSWFLSSASENKTSLTGGLLASALLSCQNFIAVLIKTKALKRSCCLTSVFLWRSLWVTGGFNGFCNPLLGLSRQKNRMSSTRCGINTHGLETPTLLPIEIFSQSCRELMKSSSQL